MSDLEKQKLESIEVLKSVYRAASDDDKISLHELHVLALDIEEELLENGAVKTTQISRHRGKPAIRRHYYSVKASVLKGIVARMCDIAEVNPEEIIIDEELPSYLTEENEAE